MNRDMLSRRLQRRGFYVRTAEAGQQALEIIGQERVDIVLLDIEMPGLSGFEVLARIRETMSPTRLPVIMITARNTSEDIVRALESGANDYVTKPVDFPVALAWVRTHLALKHAENSLRESEERYALAAAGANDGLWDWDLESNEIHLSSRWWSILGLTQPADDPSPDLWFERLHPEDTARVKSEIAAHIEGRTPHLESEHRMLHNDGGHRWVLSRGLAVRDANGRAMRMAGSLTDVTASKVSDPLTGLPNKVLLRDHLGRCAIRMKRRKGAFFAVLMVDIDRFSVVNDGLGQHVGDLMLVAFARRVEACVRGTDVVSRFHGEHTLARMGGDEFTLVLDEIKHPSDAGIVATRVLDTVAQPFKIEGHEVFVDASIGIVVGTSEYDGSAAILRDAATALHLVKARGGAGYEVFENDMRDRAMRRLSFEADLHKAVKRGEFLVHYQPVISLSKDRIHGFEALIRWQHPTRGMVNPSDFISLAEATGLIVPISEWVLHEACRQVRVWSENFFDAELTVNVNLSAQHLASVELAANLEGMLRQTGLEPGQLKLEITESVLMANPEQAAATLERVRAMGIRIAIDDFGTGYSSLTYLQELSADTLKIDRSFVSRMLTSEDSLAIVRAIMELAHSLRMDVVAEGIESPEQAAKLQTLGCDFGQGFLYSSPVSAEVATKLIADESSLAV
jgi:diguanylate cyclase (GGDEF)-like protein/PAS domain S-box-containing protein